MKDRLDFWKWDYWTSLWPRHTPSVSHAFDVSACSDDFQQRWRLDSNILSLMNTSGYHSPVTIAQVRSVARAIEEWLSSEATEEHLTVPPTVKGFQKAIEVEILASQNLAAPSIILSVLAVVRPGDVAVALSNIPTDKLSNNWKLIKQQSILGDPIADKTISGSDASPSRADFKPAPTKSSGAHSDVPAVASSPEKAMSKRTGKQHDLPVKHHEDGRRLLGWVADLDRAKNEQSSPPSVLKEMMNGFIKRDVTANKGVGDLSLNYWFEDIAFPALCTLEKEQVEKIMEYWPDHTNPTWNFPSASMEKPLFWRALRTLKGPMRGYIMDEVLPQLIDTSAWTDPERMKMLGFMVNRTNDHGWLFEERLKLWMAWGGELDRPLPIPSTEEVSVFSPIKTQTARQWLEEQKVDAWNDVLEKYPPSSRPAMKM